jgi:hypothetical protein
MRKLLLFVLVFGFGFTTIAQKGLKQQKLFKTVAKAKIVVADNEGPYVNLPNPTVDAPKDLDIVVGKTMYDLQSNSSIPQHTWAWPDGSVATVWTRGMDNPPGCPDRGTGYNYFDGTTWGAAPDARIEQTRTGWPSIAAYGTNGEIVCAHAGTGPLQFSYRTTKGQGEWQYFQLESPVADAELLWPRMTTAGENHETIHVITLVGSGYEYEGLTMALTYSRSTDGGATWDPYMEILDGMTSEDMAGVSADDYAWAIPRGDTIAFVVFGGVADGFVMKSYDNGDTWERVTFYMSPDPFFNGDGGDLPKCGGGDGYNSVAIDKEGMVHVAFGRQIHMDDVADDGSWSYWPYSDGLVYWNESMAPMDTTTINYQIIPEDWTSIPLYQNGQLAAYTHGNENDDSIVGVAPYYASLTSMAQLALTPNAKGEEIATIIYSGLAVGYSNEEMQQNYRHIYKTHSELDGVWADPPEDLTGDVFHLASECVYPSMYPCQGTFHVVYQSDNKPGNSLQPTGGNHPPVNNDIVYLPITPFPVGVNNNIDVASFDVAQNRPNPATTRTLIDVKAPRGPVTLTVSNMLGQQVYTTQKISNGTGVEFSVNVSDLSTGVYFYTVKVAEKSITKRMVVK